MGISRIVDWSNFRLNVENQKTKVIMVTYQNRGIYIYIYIYIFIYIYLYIYIYIYIYIYAVIYIYIYIYKQRATEYSK